MSDLSASCYVVIWAGGRIKRYICILEVMEGRIGAEAQCEEESRGLEALCTIWVNEDREMRYWSLLSLEMPPSFVKNLWPLGEMMASRR